jgi:AcrR family transcriptional regulator
VSRVRRPSLRDENASPSTRARRGDPKETRRRLVSAAGVAFERDGFHGTDSNAIARAAGYSPGTFYKHFADKTDVFIAVYDEWVRHEWAGLEQLLARGGAAEALARDVVALVLTLHRRWRGFRRGLLELAGQDPRVRRAWLASRARQLDTLQARLPGARATHATVLYTMERTADALANDEPEALGVDPAQLEAELVRLIAAQLRAHRR